jgi:rhodanese-related sulfurtransferase
MRLFLALATLVAAASVAAATATLASTGPPSALLSPGSFAKAVATPGTVTINVHVPDAGSIRGTDLSIPFDRIGDLKARLPARSTRLAVYCRSGTMSAVAVVTLRKLGFSRIVELRGGMNAWKQTGRTLAPAKRG